MCDPNPIIFSRISRLNPKPMDIERIITAMPKAMPKTATLITGPDNRLPGNPPFTIRFATNNSYFKTSSIEIKNKETNAA